MGRDKKVPREHKFSDSNIPRQTQIISRLCSLRIFIDNSIKLKYNMMRRKEEPPLPERSQNLSLSQILAAGH
jgi:hypothetical protein